MSPEHQLEQAEQEEKLLLADLGKQQTEVEGLFETAQLLKKEDNALLHKRELFNAVRQRLDQKNMERNVPGSIEVLMGAFVPSKPYNDRRITFTAMVLVLGLGMGSGVAFLRASRNQAIYAPKDMPHPMQVPFLGYIPVMGAKKTPGDEISPAMIESVRVVRTALLSRLDGQNSTTVLVTSAATGTGKSTFTMMLGESLAQAGKKVLMIDADFRKMALTRRFDLSNKSGFIESLCCRFMDKRHIFQTETSGLSIMPTGKQGDDGAVFEEIANGAFKTCIGQLRKQYKIILLDSSPILSVADATILSNQVDGTIMVERELVSRRANVINALARLDSAGGRLLGTVFIGSCDYKDYGYDYYYSRTSKSQL
jgi:capsular exopolysaccharide synthesis family protein